VGGALLGAKFNGGRAIMQIGGTGNPSAPFPRFPRWSGTKGTFVPSVHMTSWASQLYVYSDAFHDGTTYTLNDACCSVMNTAYTPNGYWGHIKAAKHPNPVDAYSENAYRQGFDYNSDMNAWVVAGEPDDGSRPGGYSRPRIPAWAGYRNNIAPHALGSSDLKIYGGGFAYRAGTSSSGTYLWKPTAENKATIYGVVSGFAPAAGVKHTLVLYTKAWRSKYKFLTWDQTSWPPWWTAAGVTAEGYAEWKAAIAAAAALGPTHRPSYTTTGSLKWEYFMCGDYDKFSPPDNFHGHNQWDAEQDFAFHSGYASGPTGIPDSRVILLSAHILCQPLSNYVVDLPDGLDRSQGRFPYPPSTGTINCHGNTDLEVVADVGGGMLKQPTFADSWVTSGTPYKSPPTTCWTDTYYVPLIFATPFPGTRSTTMTFGERSYTVTQLS
jgi:hypothetical protein